MTETEIMEFWKRVKRCASEKGMSIKTLCETAGVSYKSITNRISANRMPKKKGVVESLAKTLGYPIDFLTTGKTEERLESRFDFLEKYIKLSSKNKALVNKFLDLLLDGENI